jgi:1,2-dihydroxy-3-keto-5-methylthiopentene dioxygenase
MPILVLCRYRYEDEVKVEASMENYEERLKICSSEHLHPKDEIRLILEGSGFFDVRDRKNKWIRIHVFPGDLLILPAGKNSIHPSPDFRFSLGIYHRFIPDKQVYIRVRRYFVNEPLWLPVERFNADLQSSHKIYVEHLFRNGTVDTGLKNADAMS